MSSIITLPVSLLLFLAMGLSLTSAGRPGPPPPPPPQKGCPNCAGVRCRTPLCADPVTPPGKCCPSCANSQCKFEGCVQLLPEVSWRPVPSTRCTCRNGNRLCGVMDCQFGPDITGTTIVLLPRPEDCFGNPVTSFPTSPSVFCPRCDFGVPENECQVVPSERESFSISFGSNTCSGQITKHRCDKIGYRDNGKLFRCESSSVTRSATIQGCDPFIQILYKDVGSCTAVEAPTDISLIDADGCDFLVSPARPRGPVGPVMPTPRPTGQPGSPTQSTTPPGQGQPGQPTSGDPTAPPGPQGNRGPPGRPGPPGK